MSIPIDKRQELSDQIAEAQIGYSNTLKERTIYRALAIGSAFASAAFFYLGYAGEPIEVGPIDNASVAAGALFAIASVFSAYGSLKSNVQTNKVRSYIMVRQSDLENIAKQENPTDI